jgi:hypothetical protein
LPKSARKATASKRTRTNASDQLQESQEVVPVPSSDSAVESGKDLRKSTARPTTARVGTARPTTARPAPPKVITKQQLQDQLAESEGNTIEPIRTIQAIAANTSTGSGPLIQTMRDQTATNESDGEPPDDSSAPTELDESVGLNRSVAGRATGGGSRRAGTVDNYEYEEDEEGELSSGGLFGGRSVDREESEKGALVRKLVQSKHALEGVAESMDRSSSSMERVKSAVQQLDSGQLKKVMDGVQKLCRLANPTSKTIEYLQEELDMMLAERRTWLSEARSNRAALQSRQSDCANELNVLRDELNALEEHVQQQRNTRQERISCLWRTHQTIVQATAQLVEQ